MRGDLPFYAIWGIGMSMFAVAFWYGATSSAPDYSTLQSIEGTVTAMVPVPGARGSVHYEMTVLLPSGATTTQRVLSWGLRREELRNVIGERLDDIAALQSKPVKAKTADRRVYELETGGRVLITYREAAARNRRFH